MRYAACAACIVLLAGCYRSHVRAAHDDGGPVDSGARVDAGTRDAGPPVDAGSREGRYWIPVETERADVSVERCEMREGQTPIFHAHFFGNLCDEPGNVRWSIDVATHTVTLDPFVWRPEGVPPCPPAAIEIDRDVALYGVTLEPGEWRLQGPSSSVTFAVYPGPPELTCTDCRDPGAECVADTECVGAFVCVPVRGDAACRAVCAAPCQPFPVGPDTLDLACTDRVGPSTCESDPDLGWVCRDAPGDRCPICEAGTSCDPSGGGVPRCVWQLSPWDAGGVCVSDDDCLPGLSCVDLSDGLRLCRVRCRGDHPCPGTACGQSDVVCPIPKI